MLRLLPVLMMVLSPAGVDADYLARGSAGHCTLPMQSVAGWCPEEIQWSDDPLPVDAPDGVLWYEVQRCGATTPDDIECFVVGSTIMAGRSWLPYWDAPAAEEGRYYTYRIRGILSAYERDYTGPWSGRVGFRAPWRRCYEDRVEFDCSEFDARAAR